MSTSNRKISLLTAISVVVANMIGTGVFTSLGFQLFGIQNTSTIVVLWLIGGIISLCGAVNYGELGVAFPRSGGEYNYLSKTYHPYFGFLSGWISSTVGFAAPVALSAMLLGGYASKVFPTLQPQIVAAIVVIILTIIHSRSIEHGSKFQNISTAIKISLITFIITCGLLAEPVINSGSATSSTFDEMISPAFAISLFFVSYSYSGWNAAAYIAGEMDSPKKNLPKALFVGTLIVTILYVLLNYVFMRTALVSEMVGQPEVAYFPAKHIFGDNGANVISLIISLLLVSSVSSMVLAGPRVAHAIGEDIKLLNFLGKFNSRNIPERAIIVQCLITLVFIATGTFEQVITYLGFTLNLFTFFTVMGIFILRKRKANITSDTDYKAWAYPYSTILFLIFGLWLMVYGVVHKPLESLLGLITLVIGTVIYFINIKLHSAK